jgi:hypothetical protein
MSNPSIKMPKLDSFLSIYPQPSPGEFYSGSDQSGKKVPVSHLRDGVDHVEPHLDGVPGVVATRVRQPGHAVVAITQDLYTQAVVLLQTKRIINV